MTQNEVAVASDLATRTYADIEQGTMKMRVDTIIHIFNALHITPDEMARDEARHGKAFEGLLKRYFS